MNFNEVLEIDELCNLFQLLVELVSTFFHGVVSFLPSNIKFMDHASMWLFKSKLAQITGVSLATRVHRLLSAFTEPDSVIILAVTHPNYI